MRNFLSFIQSICSHDSKSGNTIDYKNYIIERIKTMRESQNLTFEEISDTLNSDGMKPISGRGAWTVIMVEKIYTKEALKNHKD